MDEQDNFIETVFNNHAKPIEKTMVWTLYGCDDYEGIDVDGYAIIPIQDDLYLIVPSVKYDFNLNIFVGNVDSREIRKTESPEKAAKYILNKFKDNFCYKDKSAEDYIGHIITDSLLER